uniref:Chromogranin-A n=1 Tax=Athene cunicularia TaxID=194338 RepID=A0A663M568_ATHCN
MSRPGLLAVLLLAVPAISLPVTNDMNKGDTKVMKCIVEVISDTLSKPNPLPISEECLETLRGDERIISILRHQNLLKELQEIAAQDAAGESPEEEQPTGSLAEPAAQKTQQNEDSREEGKNSLEMREPRPRDANPGEKEDHEEAESNEIGDTEDAQRDEALDNHISKDFNEDEQRQQEDEEEQPRGPRDSLELENEGEQPSRQGQKKSKEVTGERVEREDDGGDDAAEEDPTEAERSLDLAEEDEEAEEMQGDDNNDDALGFGKDVQSSEEEEEEEEQPRTLRGGRHRLEDEGVQGEEDTFQPRDAKSEEMEESSREWEDSKRWNKMDELAKQLTSKKRMEENDSGEDPDRSMKLAFRSHKYDFSSPEEDVRRSWKHHSKEDSSEGFPLAPMPEEKKDEEGSANRRTEDQELESLAAIEAELERVAHKLHELRRG